MRGFAWGAFGLWAWAEGCALSRRAAAARLPWTAGGMLLAIHSVLAFQQVHHWSHAAAVEETARQTEAVMGLNWGGGIWFNYAMITLWLADIGWLWWRPTGEFGARRRHPLRWFLAGMWLNGAVIFAHSPLRWPAAMVFLFLASKFHKRFRGESAGDNVRPPRLRG